VAAPAGQKGVPNRATLEIRETARQILNDPAYVKSLKRRLVAGRASHMETLLHYYAYGKPKDTVEQAIAQEVEIRSMSTEQLVAEAKALIEKAERP
jgi:hypothetical protein